MKDHKIEFQTKDILIRPLSLGDFEEMVTLTSDPEMWVFFTSDLSKQDVLQNWITTAIEDESRIAFAVIEKNSGKTMGSTSIGNISQRDKRAEIGWTWIAKPFQGKGYNARIKAVLLKYLFEERELERVECKTDVLNSSARNSLEKTGFTKEGVLRSHTLMTNSRRRDTIFYSVLRSEWRKMK